MKDKITQSDFEKAIEGAPHGYEVTIGGKACWNLHQQSLQQILEEAGEELPDEGAIKKLWITGDRIAAAKWMCSEASKVVAKLKHDYEVERKISADYFQQIQQLKEELARKEVLLNAAIDRLQEAKEYCRYSEPHEYERICDLIKEYQASKTDKP